METEYHLNETETQTVREEKQMSDILSKQYERICSRPRESIDSENFEIFLHDNNCFVQP